MAPPGMKSYPSAAFILTLIGGIFILLAGLAFAALAAIIGSLAISVVPAAGAILIAYAIVALLFGIIIIFGALQMRSKPQSAKMWGIIVIVLAIIALVTTTGGFFIGFILTLIGGIMAIIWHPPMMAQPAWGQPAAPMAAPGAPPAAAPGQKFCGSCGSPNPAGAQTCAKCGAPLPP
jgi:hypothetical protein